MRKPIWLRLNSKTVVASISYLSLLKKRTFCITAFINRELIKHSIIAFLTHVEGLYSFQDERVVHT